MHSTMIAKLGQPSFGRRERYTRTTKTKIPKVDEMIDRKPQHAQRLLQKQQQHMDILSERIPAAMPKCPSPKSLPANGDAAAHLRRDSECSSTSLDLADLMMLAPAHLDERSDDGLLLQSAVGRARCCDAGLSVESSMDLSELRELAALSSREHDGDENNDNDKGDSSLSLTLANLNSRNHSSWGDFAVAEGTSTPLHCKGSSRSLGNRQRRRPSWLDPDDIILDHGDVDGGRKSDPSPSSGPGPGPRSVRFSRRPHDVHDHVALSDMTPSEKRSFWYDESDHESIQLDIIRSLSSLQSGHGKGGGGKNGGDGVGEDVCLRGLENSVRDGCWIDTHRKTNGAVVEAVMEVQRRWAAEAKQDAYGGGGRGRGRRGSSESKEEVIAAASRALTRPAREMAAAVGRNDAAVVAAVRTMTGLGARRVPRRKCRTSAAA